MANFRDIHDQRVRQLAETLKRNGLAASETEAVSMAQSMAQTESRVNQTFNEKKDSAVMSTGGKGPSGAAGAMNTQSIEQDHFRDEEVSAQEPAAQRQPASQPIAQQNALAGEPETPTREVVHSNNAIAEAISNVQAAYSEPQSINIQETERSVQNAEDLAQMPVGMQHADPDLIKAVNNNETLASVINDEPKEEPTPRPEPQSQQMMYEEPPMPEPEQHTEAAPQNAESTIQQNSGEYSDGHGIQYKDQPEDEDGMVEKSREVTERPPARDRSHYEESKVDLADVFNFNKR